MADSDKNILITPNRSQTAQPSIAFTGKGNIPITLRVLDDSTGTLSFEGSAGQLFSINNNLASGTIFSVNDVSGIPMIDVDASGLVRLAPLGGTVYSNTLYGVTKTVAGSGNSVTIRAADGVTSGGGGSIVLQPGQQVTTGGDGRIVVRQPNGTAGTNEATIHHTGTDLIFTQKNSAGGNYTFYAKDNYPTSLPQLQILADGTTTGLTLYAKNVDNNSELRSSGSLMIYSSSGSTYLRSSSNNTYIRQYLNFENINGHSDAALSIPTYRAGGVLLVSGSENGGSFAYSANTPTLAATNNNLVLSGSAIHRLSYSAASVISGIAPPSTALTYQYFNGGIAHFSGRVIWLTNVGSFNITLQNQNANSTAENRFVCETGADMVLGPNRTVMCVYDSTLARWRVSGANYPYNFPTTDGTNGQVLTTNGSGTLSWATSSGGVSGSGTTNYVTKFTGASAVGNSQIFDDGTNVGIGTTTANNKLHIYKATGSVAMTLQTGSAYAYFVNNGTDGILASSAGSTGNKIRYNLNAPDDAVYINNVGSMGLGQTSPGAKLHVETGAAGTKGLIVKAVANPTANFLELQNSSGTNLVAVDSTGELILGSGVPAVPSVTTAKLWIAAGTQNPGAVSAAGTTAMMVAGGNIFVCGDGTLSDQAAVIFRGADGAGSKARFLFVGDSSVKNSSITSIVDTQGQSGHLAFDTAPSAASGLQERMRITSAGDVGIGTSSPATKLHVVGAIRSSGYTAGDGTYLALTGDLPGYSANTYPTLRSDGSIYFSVANRYAAYLSSSDNSFGIANTSTQWRVQLHPNGTSYFTGGALAVGATTAAGGGQVYITPQASGTKGLVVRGAASQSANLTEWQTSAGQVNAFFAPDGKLSVLQNTQTQQGGVEESVAGFGQKQFWSNGDAGLISVGFTDIAGTYNVGSNKWDMYFKTGDSSGPSGRTERLRILGSNGNVGIGTKVPDKLLTIAGNAATPQINIYKSPDGSINSAQLVASLGTGSSNSNSGTTGGNEFGILQLLHSGTVRCQIYAGGNGWIMDGMSFGTNSSPGAQVLVVPSAAATKGLIVRGAASQSANLQEWQNSGGTVLASADSAGNISTPRLIAPIHSSSSGLQLWHADNVADAASSGISFGYSNWGSSYMPTHWTFKRTLPDTSGNFVELFSLPGQQASYFELTVVAYKHAEAFESKSYVFATQYLTGGGILQPTFSHNRSPGFAGFFGNHFEVELNTNVEPAVVRVRRTSTSGTGVAIFAHLRGMHLQGITEKTGTGTSSIGLGTLHGTQQVFPTSMSPPTVSSGAGNSIGLYAGNGATSGAGGSIILQPGLQATTGGNGTVVVRQPGGAAGTDEIQLSHDGGKGSIINKDGTIQLGGANIAIRNVANNNTTTVTAGTLYSYGINSNDSMNADGVCNDSYSWAIDGNSLSWNQNFHMRVSWSHIKGYGCAGIAYTGNNTNARYATLEITDGGSFGGSLAYRSTDHTISANTNDLTPARFSAMQRWAPTANYNVTGLAAGATTSFSGGTPTAWIHTNGRVIWVHNVSTAYNITLKHEDAGSTATNRFLTETGTDIIMPPNSMVMLTYDSTSARWRVHTLSSAVKVVSTTTNISAATNNLALSNSSFQRLNCTTACNLTGVAPPSGGSHADGRTMRIYNVGTANLTLKHNSTLSDIPNRFCCVQAVDIILAPRDYAELIYDGTDGGLVGGQNNPCWRVH